MADEGGHPLEGAEQLGSALDHAHTRMGEAALGGRPFNNFFELLLILLICFGVLAAALLWQLFFGDDETGHAPGEEENHQFMGVPPSIDTRAVVVVVPAERLQRF